MKLNVKPQEVTFCIGDTVLVSEPCGDVNAHPYFQGEIIQIILDGSLMSTTVIRQREQCHDLVVSSAVYDMHPVGVHAGIQQVRIQIGLFTPQEMLFGTEIEVQAYQIRQNSSRVKGITKL